MGGMHNENKAANENQVAHEVQLVADQAAIVGHGIGVQITSMQSLRHAEKKNTLSINCAIHRRPVNKERKCRVNRFRYKNVIAGKT
jgi:hypothetical protein